MRWTFWLDVGRVNDFLPSDRAQDELQQTQRQNICTHSYIFSTFVRFVEDLAFYLSFARLKFILTHTGKFEKVQFQHSVPKSTKYLSMPEKTTNVSRGSWHIGSFVYHQSWAWVLMLLTSSSITQEELQYLQLLKSAIYPNNYTDHIFSAPSLSLERHIFAKSFCFCQNIQSANPEG